MAKKLLIIIGAAIVLAFIFTLVGSLAGNDGNVAEAPTSEGDPSAEVPGSDAPEAIAEPGGNVVAYTSSGFEPRTLTVAAGEAVRFVNESSRPFWPASAVHPTHKVYPGSDIEKCGTGEAASIFDACDGIEPGEEWEFTFNELGTWRYHDHLNVSRTGTIVVE